MTDSAADHVKKAIETISELVDAALEAEAILRALTISTPLRRTEGLGVWTFEDDFIRAAHARLLAALRKVSEA